MARDRCLVVGLVAALAALFGCSSESGTNQGDEGPALQGELCVDASDACCCDEELPYEEVVPSCRIAYSGADFSDWTFELVTETGSSVLPRLASASECTTAGGFYPSTAHEMELELCEVTCAIRQDQRTRLRILAGCPSTPC